MKIWSITIVFAITAFSSLGKALAPKELGIGFVVATDPYQFEDGSHYENIYTDRELQNRWTGNTLPFFYKPDYGLYHFMCLEKTDRYYKILINDIATAYIPNDTHFYFKTWDMILINASVKRLTTDNPIRDELNSNRTVEYKCASGQLQVKDVIEKHGEYWLQISFSPICDDQEIQRTYGWIKWRTKNKLLVDILLLC